MSDLALLLSTVAFDYTLSAALVGVAFRYLTLLYAVPTAGPLRVVGLFLVFAALDTYWLPSLNVLNLTFTIHNEAVARFLELAPGSPGSELLSIGWFDAVVWLLQTAIALGVARLLPRPK